LKIQQIVYMYYTQTIIGPIIIVMVKSLTLSKIDERTN